MWLRLQYVSVILFASVAHALELGDFSTGTIRNNTIQYGNWNVPLQIPGLVSNSPGTALLQDVSGSVHYTMWTAGDEVLPVGISMEMSTGTLRGTPRTECSGDIAGCSENYTILVYATDDSTKSLLVENFTLSLSYKVVAGIDHINGSGGKISTMHVLAIVFGAALCVMVMAILVTSRRRTAANLHSVAHKTNSAFPEEESVEHIELDSISIEQQQGAAESYIDGDISRGANHLYLEVSSAEATQEPQPRPRTASTPQSHAVVHGRFSDDAGGVTDVDGGVTDLDTDEAQPWYAMHLRRSACETAVASAGHGDFLIRRSRASPHSEAPDSTGAPASRPQRQKVVLVLVANNHGTAMSFPITLAVDASTASEVFVFGGTAFPSLRSLVRYLRIHPITGVDGQPFVLAAPAPFDANADGSMLSAYARGTTSTPPTTHPAHPSWFVGVSSRGQVETLVAQAGHGDYLVRKSRSDHNYVLCVNDYGRLVNFRIYQRDGQTYEFGGKFFDSIDTLLAYVRNADLVGADGHSALRLNAPAGQTTTQTTTQTSVHPPVPRPRPRPVMGNVGNAYSEV